MAAEPPLASRKVFSGFSTPHVASHGLHLANESQQFGAIIHEIEHVRSRFESEKSTNDQFSQQVRIVAQQIASLTDQQSSMIGFHIGRMDSMLKELKNSSDTISQAKQRATFEAEHRAKFEQGRREREHLERERLEREHLERERMERERIERERTEREERERQLLHGKLERERRAREDNEREQRAREQEEREHRDKLESLRRCSLPAMNLGDIIPRPSRTVEPSKRKLSLDVGQLHGGTAAKRAKICAADLPLSCDNNNVVEDNVGNNESQSNDADTGAADMDTSADKTSDTSSPIGDSDSLPVDIQEMLKQQALTMLQAQFAATEHASIVKPEFPSAAMHPSSSSSSSLSAYERPSTFEEEKAGPPPATHESAVKHESAIVKDESAVVKPKKAKKAKKAATPAVEDTSIADPMSIPLKNKAIHQWMSKDPERLYTADDICKAGIRYRASLTNSRTGAHKGRIYVLTRRPEVQQQLADRNNNRRLWKFEKRGWKVITA